MPLIDDIRDLIEHETTEAQGLLRTVCDAMPKSVEARLLLATSHLRRLEFDQAIAHYRETVALDPKNLEALGNIAFCLLAKGELEAALAANKTAFDTTLSALPLRFMGLIAHRLGRLDEAIAAYGRVLNAAPPASMEIVHSLQGIAAALRDAGRPVEADHYMRTLIDRYRREPLVIANALVVRNNSDDFHEWSPLADKSRLAALLAAGAATDPAGRVPESFVLPRDRAALEAFAARPDAPALYIVKPIRSSGGQGIGVTADVATTLDRTNVVVQRYIDRPFLIDGRKGHCRIYGLITSVDPLRAYVYSEGIVRIAPEPYDPDPARGAGPAMHVTNTALHLGHPGLQVSQDANLDDVGAIRSLSALLRRTTDAGLDGQAVFGEIKALMTWFIRRLADEGLFARQAAQGPPRGFPPKLFGLDVLIDEAGHPWLLEMQRTPAPRGSPLIERINGEMFKTMFAMSHAPLFEEGMPGDQLDLLRRDDAARRRREAEIAFANRGKFELLDL